MDRQLTSPNNFSVTGDFLRIDEILNKIEDAFDYGKFTKIGDTIILTIAGEYHTKEIDEVIKMYKEKGWVSICAKTSQGFGENGGTLFFFSITL